MKRKYLLKLLDKDTPYYVINDPNGVVAMTNGEFLTGGFTLGEAKKEKEALLKEGFKSEIVDFWKI